jgi:hypothetical protein
MARHDARGREYFLQLYRDAGFKSGFRERSQKRIARDLWSSPRGASNNFPGRCAWPRLLPICYLDSERDGPAKLYLVEKPWIYWAFLEPPVGFEPTTC